MTASVLRMGPSRGEDGTTEQVEPRPGSVAEVYEAHVDYVFRCLRGLGLRGGQVEDAVQDVFLVVNDKLHGFDGRANLRTWLYAIVIRVARRYRERMARSPAALIDEPAGGRSAEHDYLSREQLDLARQALSALSDEKREVFVLTELEQLSAPEIATITGAPLNTVYSRLRTARIEFDRQIQLLLNKPRTRSGITRKFQGGRDE